MTIIRRIRGARRLWRYIAFALLAVVVGSVTAASAATAPKLKSTQIGYTTATGNNIAKVDADGNLQVGGSVGVSGTVNVGNLPATQAVNGTVDVGNLPSSQTVNGTVNVGNLPATQAVTGTVNVGNLPAAPVLVNGLGSLIHGNGNAHVIVPAGDVLTDVIVNYSGNGVAACDAVEIIAVDPSGAKTGVYTQLLTNQVVNGPAQAEFHLQSGIPSTANSRVAISNTDGVCSFDVFWTGHQ